MKKFFSILLILAFIFNIVYTQPALAATDLSKTTYFPDGSYIVTTLSINETSARSTTKSASKTDTAYSTSGSKLYSFTVTATFEINSGSSVKCTSASYSKSIYNNSWSFVSASTSRNNSSTSKASATSKGIFKNSAGKSNSLSPTVSCDKNGNIS